MPRIFRDRRGPRDRQVPGSLPPAEPQRGVVRGWALGLVALVAVAVTGHLFIRAEASRDDQSDPAALEVVRCALPALDLKRLPCASAFLVEAETGAVLYEQNADERRGPASLVKMMVQLLVFEEVVAGKVSLTDSITTSANASTMGGSQVFLKHNEVQTLEALLDAIIIASANDAAMAVAEHMAGSESAFVERMNERAAELGCTGTRFENVHGLDLRGRPRNVTTARDLATIARQLVRHPKAVEISGTWRKPFRGGEFWLDNTNKLLRDFDGLDGLKTGWTPRAGGCFVGTATRDGVRLIAVVLKGPSGKGRFQVAKRLLEAGYRAGPRWVQVARAGQIIHTASPPSGLAKAPHGPMLGPVVAAGSVRVLMEKGQRGFWRLRPRPESVSVPRDTGVLGYLDYRLDGRTVATVPAGPPDRS